VEPRRRALGYLRGLLSQVERKHSWWLAERAGGVTPDGMQRLLNGSGWDADGVRDDLRDYGVAQLGDPNAVLVLDETGFVKQGNRSAGVQRQYTGTVGKQENCQVAVLLAYAGTRWGGAGRPGPVPAQSPGPTTGRAAGRRVSPDEVGFQTKPQLGQAIVERALAAGVPFGWVTGDTVYGGDRRLRVWLEEHAIRHVMAVKCTEPVRTLVRPWPWAGRRPGPDRSGPAARWLRISAGDGSKGKRFYDWTRCRCGAGAGRPTWVSGCWPAAASATRASWPTTSAYRCRIPIAIVINHSLAPYDYPYARTRRNGGYRLILQKKSQIPRQ
jgi:SRSO17 transposase